LLVGQPLALGPRDEQLASVGIADLPVFVAEGKLIAVAWQMPTDDRGFGPLPNRRQKPTEATQAPIYHHVMGVIRRY